MLNANYINFSFDQIEKSFQIIERLYYYPKVNFARIPKNKNMLIIKIGTPRKFQHKLDKLLI